MLTTLRLPAHAAAATTAALAGALAGACEPPPSSVWQPSTPPDASSGDGPSTTAPAGTFELLGAPLVFAPTRQGFGISVVLRAGDPARLRARVRAPGGGSPAWVDLGAPLVPAPDLARWSSTGLEAGQRYAYEIRADDDDADGGPPPALYSGSAATAPDPGTPFTFALISDTHIETRDPIPPGYEIADDTWGFDEQTLLAVAAEVAAGAPDFVLNLGDMLDYHVFGFNAPPPAQSWARLAYLDYRRMLGDGLGHMAHFPVIGNWDGESGCNTPDEIERSLSQRLLYLPGPGPDTYPQGGSANGDY